MFGRRKEEDYDEYNERYAAKYDDDYIAPKKEYRRECGHSHEQSYSNINTVAECDHSHEQTYNDADSEQLSYDSYASLESRFQPYLAPNEHLLWVGGYDKLSPKPPQERKKDKKRNAVLIIISVLLMLVGIVACPLFFIGFIMFILTVVAAAGGFQTGVNAITDMRVINIRNNSTAFIPLAEIYNINAVVNGNNKGYINYSTKRPVRAGQVMQNGQYRSGITGITDPQRVKRILQDAVHGAMANNRRN
ncbi:hypothetical protein [Ruminococcus flavefaciens]|uniref:hypothetical protein n=1 Tax=Ruminococcus flavefaciens TaxID=1265 RepID=UPI0026EA4DFB|nr:hypothetical protein [Ruminococcus flavefaciens]